MKTILFSFIFCLIGVCLNAQPGTLDKTFGDSGIVIGQGYIGSCTASVLQSDGKIIVAGNNYAETGGFLAVRYDSAGSPDISFGDNGIVNTSFYSSPEVIGLQSSGKLITTSQTGGGNSNIIVLRYNINGSIDSSFGVNGIDIIDFTIYDEVLDMAIQSDDKIIIIGRVDNRENDQPTIVMARYLPDGSADENFGKNGKEFIVYQNQLIDNISIALQQGGKILLGSADEGINFFVERYLANGEKDSAFGIDGKASCKFANIQYSIVNKIALTADGKIVAGGSTQSAQDFIESMTLARFDSAGIADTSFGTNGTVITKFDSGANSEIASVSIQPDKKIIGAGRKYIDYGNNKYSYFALVRYNENGSLDSSFADDGIQTTSVGYFDDVSNTLLQNNGKIILTGSTNVGENGGVTHYALARYNNESKKQIIINKIKHYISTHNNAGAATLNSYIILYPNPAKDIVTIKGFDAKTNYELSVINNKGNIVATKQVNNLSTYQFNIQNLSSGVYYVNVVANNKLITTLKFVKQ